MLIVQISDFHLKPDGVLAYDAADTAAALKQVVNYINRLNPVPDVVIATGDIADGGAWESYELARGLLAPLKMPLYMVPGNHDQKNHLADVFSTHTYLRDRVPGTEGSYICYTIDDYPVRLIGLDTVTPGEHGGGLGPARLEWLDRKLSQRPEIPTLIFMHHPPFASAIGHMDIEPFRRRNAFAKLILRYRQVERITCGHIHRPISRLFAGTVATVCPGVGMQIVLDLRPEAPSGFNLEPPALMIHCLHTAWGDDPALLTHVSIVVDPAGENSGFHPFFGVVSPT
jgi:3',5'-cyclic AMP phosphodiesterase CpdA